MSNERKFLCPVCGNNSLGYNAAKKVGHCFSCQRGYGEQALIRLLGFLPGGEFDHLVQEPAKEKAAPDFDGMCWAMDHPIGSWSLIKDRGCWSNDIEQVLFDPSTERVWFPIHPIGKTPGLRLYGDIQHKSWITRSVYRSRKGWKREGPDIQDGVYGVLHPEASCLILVEGIWDVLTPRLTGTALALLGTHLTQEQGAWIALTQKPVVLWMDADKAGAEAFKKLHKHLSGIVEVYCTDYSKEPGDCTPEEARWVLSNCLKKDWWSRDGLGTGIQ